jgi:alpha-tubulin suppressor-like RCC1 family protein
MKKRLISTAIILAVFISLLPAVTPSAQAQTPTQTISNTRFTASAGGTATAAIGKTDGSLWMWGNNGSGQLGDGTAINRHAPVKMMDDVVAVSLGGAHSAAIRIDNSLWIWGINNFNQLGITGGTRRTPVKIMDDVASVSLGSNHTAAILNDGSLWTWGINTSGQLGYAMQPTGFSTEPVKIMDNVAAVSTGDAHTAAIKTDGSLWTWGANWSGQLGDGTTTDSHSPIKIMDDVVAISLGGNQTAAIKADGSLWMWGVNGLGQLGDGTVIHRNAPVKIMDDVSAVSTGSTHSAAVKTDGSLWIWGWNIHGELGDGTTTDRRSPIKIMDDVAVVSTGTEYTIAMKTDGSLWAWGANRNGRLGDGTNIDSNTPVRVLSGTGEGHFYALLPGEIPMIPYLTQDRGLPISFLLYDMHDETPIGDATVTIEGVTKTTDAAGMVTFDGIGGHIITFTAEADGYTDIRRDFYVFPNSSLTLFMRQRDPEKIHLTNVTISDPGRSVHEVLNGSILTFDKTNTRTFLVTYDIDWGDHLPGSIVLRGISSGREERFAHGRAYVAFGRDFPAGETFEVIATAQDGTDTLTRRLNIRIANLMTDASFSLPTIESESIFGVEFLEGYKFKFEIENLAKLPGVETEVKDGKLSIELKPNRFQSVKLGLLENYKVDFNLSFKVEIPVADFENGTWSGHIVGSISEVTLLQKYGNYVVANPILIPPVIPITLELKITADASLELGVRGSPGGGASFSGKIEAELTVDASAGLGFKVNDSNEISAKGFIAGDINLPIEFYPPSVKPTVSLYGGARLTGKVFGMGGKVEVEIFRATWPSWGAAPAPAMFAQQESSWQLIGRDYLSAPSGFVGDALAIQAFGFGASNINNTRIYENIFETAQSEIQIVNGVPVIVYTIDDTSRAEQDGLKLVFSTYNGSTWSEPQAINDTGTMDSGFHFNGTSLVWEKTKSNLPDGISNFTDIMKESEIYYSSFSGTSWSTPDILTDNAVADFAPVVAESGDKRMAAWLTNSESDIFGNSGTTDICYRIYDGTAWGAVQTIANVGSVGRIAIGFDGAVGMIVYKESGILYRIETGNGIPVAMGGTRDYALGFRNGRYTLANFDENGNITITEDLLGAPSSITIMTEARLHTSPMIVQNDNSLYVCWVEHIDGSDALCGVNYLNGVWSERMILISNTDSIRRPNITLAADGTLYTTYLQEEPMVMREVGGILIFEVGKSDLYVTTIYPGYDIAIENDSLYYLDRYYSAGGVAIMGCTVVNVGQRQINGFEIQIYENGELKSTISRNNHTLKAGEAADIEFMYRPSATGIMQTLMVKIVPVGGATDVNELNNTGFITLGAVDAVMTEAFFTRIYDTYWLTATVHNEGSITSDLFTLTVRRDSVDGEILLTKRFENVIANERISFFEPIEGIVFTDGIASFFVVVEAENDFALYNNSILAVAEYIENDFIRRGDVNGNGVVDASDALELLLILAELKEPEEWQKSAGKVTDSFAGPLSVRDVTEILMIVAGMKDAPRGWVSRY